MRLLGDGTRFLGLWLGAEPRAGGGARRRARALRWPLAVHARSMRAGALARHLGAAPGSFVLVRPDAYVARAARRRPTPAAIERGAARARWLARRRAA